jgi:hypothetical protein
VFYSDTYTYQAGSSLMYKRRILAVAAAVTASLTATSGAFAASASTVSRSQLRPAQFTSQLHYTFDRGETLADGSLVTNVGHPDAPGRVGTAFDGRLRVVAGHVRRGAAFPKSCLSCGRGIIEAPDRPGLDPGRFSISFGVAARVVAAQAQGVSNLLQKGVYNQSGGQYKLQLVNGHPSCVIFGSRGRLVVRSKTSVADGTWHTLNCSRIRARVTLRVDGTIVGRLLGPTGVISNAATVRVGGLALFKANNQYHGVLDDVYIRINR